MEFATYNLLEYENYIRENNLNLIFSLNLCFYKINFYGNNPKYYFTCFCHKSNYS